MSLDCNGEIRSDRIYLPADEQYRTSEDSVGFPIDEEVHKYVEREFPRPKANAVARYTIPRTFVRHGEEQGSLAEFVSHRRFCELGSSSGAQWVLCFQGMSYAGRSKKSSRGGKIMTREHDLVVFVKCDDKHYALLIEVKSTCDDPDLGYKTSDALAVKNNKRSAQHQLEDHVEILVDTCKVAKGDLRCFTFWPFLSMWTVDPRGKRVRRWEKEADSHAFIDTVSEQERFDEWFRDTVLAGKSIEKSKFDALIKRFVILSCGIFVNEIHDGMLALLSQEQVSLIHTKPCSDGTATIVHGAAGTGKTLLVLHKLKFLYESGLLNEKNRALYICYWPGIRADFRRKLEKLNLSAFVDTTRFFISLDDFMNDNEKKYRHIFMDECEAICLAFSELIVSNTIENINSCRCTEYDEEFSRKQIELYGTSIGDGRRLFGDYWFLVDINQATLFIPKFSPTIFKKASVTLSRVMRNTGTIYRVFSQFYKNPLPKVMAASKLSEMYLSNIDMGHDIDGPPIYWVNTGDATNATISTPSAVNNKTFNCLVRVVIDLYSTKGIRPCDMCVLPFFVSGAYLPDNVNHEIEKHFVANGYRPVCTQRVEEFLVGDAPTTFLLPWVLRVKGLEFKVVVISIEGDDFDCSDPEDRRKIYVMASRCTCLLIIVTSESVKDAIDVYNVMKPYPFGIEFN